MAGPVSFRDFPQVRARVGQIYSYTCFKLGKKCVILELFRFVVVVSLGCAVFQKTRHGRLQIVILS